MPHRIGVETEHRHLILKALAFVLSIVHAKAKHREYKGTYSTVFVRSKSELLLSLHTRLKYYDTCATQTKILNLDGTPPPESSCLSRLLCSSPLPFQMRSSLEREVSLSLLLDDRINENTGARQ